MDPQTAGDQDPDMDAAPAASAPPPVDAAAPASPLPEAPLRLPDDDDDLTDENLAAITKQFFSQPQAVPEPGIQGERVSDAPVAEEVLESPTAAAAAAPAIPDRGTQYRQRADTPEEEAYFQLRKAGRTAAEAAIAAFGVASPVPAPAADPPDALALPSSLLPAAAALVAHDAELDRIEQSIADAKAAYDPEAETKAFLEHSKAQRVRQELVLARDREATVAQAAAETARMSAEQAVIADTVARYHGLENPNSRIRQEFDALWGQLEATNDPVLNAPDRVAIVAEKAAAAIYVASLTRPASAPPAPSRAPVPVPAARFSPAVAGAAPPPAVPGVSDDDLEEMPEAVFQQLSGKTLAGINSLARR